MVFLMSSEHILNPVPRKSSTKFPPQYQHTSNYQALSLPKQAFESLADTLNTALSFVTVELSGWKELDNDTITVSDGCITLRDSFDDTLLGEISVSIYGNSEESLDLEMDFTPQSVLTVWNEFSITEAGLSPDQTAKMISDTASVFF